jgi:hypothetical protein
MHTLLARVALVVVTLSLVAPTSALANSESQTYMLVLEHPNVAAAPNGDQVAVTGEGTFSVNPKSVDAEGSFTHSFAGGGSITGTWTATQLLEYQSYGCGVVFGTPIPANLCGGAVKMGVTLTATTPSGVVTIDGILTVFCLIGPNPPNSASEGITLVVPGIINFNKVVSGENVYIRSD